MIEHIPVVTVSGISVTVSCDQCSTSRTFATLRHGHKPANISAIKSHGMKWWNKKHKKLVK